MENIKVGDYVRKIKGYTYIGVVVSVFPKTTGEVRMVVEVIDDGNCKGMLHIFEAAQFEKI